MELVSKEKVSLLNNPNINEDMIQSFIFENPSVLGLGDISPLRREKIQPSKGRLDLLLGDESTRYEVEVQLGATDPSHIIRTIEYWDSEKRRYPQYDHCAVIVAEDITSRFMNVISLFNGAIPLIAISVSAYKESDGKVSLVFTKVLDRVTYGDEEDNQFEVTDRKYWESRSTSKMLKYVDEIYNDFSALVPGYELKYNKFYIGLNKDGISKNIFSFRPKKQYLYVGFKGMEQQELINQLEDAGFEITYDSRWREYQIRVNDISDYKKHKELFNQLLESSKEYLKFEEE
ncbi:hypothetical protein J6Z48_02650 [bacterium]|nr:hypothetical protein [bacterium]